MLGTRTILPALVVLAALASDVRGQVGFQPGIGVFPNGINMQATPVVSKDRRYVRLGVDPQFTALIGFDTFGVPAAVSGGPAGPAALAGAGLGGFLGAAGASPETISGLFDERTALGGRAIGGAAGPMNPDAAVARAVRARAAKPANRPAPFEIRADRPVAASGGPQKAKIQP